MKLISFEGIEGVGKSTQINLILNWLTDIGLSSKLRREPGSTKFGEKIRSEFYLKTQKFQRILNYC